MHEQIAPKKFFADYSQELLGEMRENPTDCDLFSRAFAVAEKLIRTPGATVESVIELQFAIYNIHQCPQHL